MKQTIKEGFFPIKKKAESKDHVKHIKSSSLHDGRTRNTRISIKFIDTRYLTLPHAYFKIFIDVFYFENIKFLLFFNFILNII